MTSAGAFNVDQAQRPDAGSAAIASPVKLRHFLPAHLPSLVAFLNRAFAGHRHYAPITEGDFAERVLVQPGFDPRGLILGMQGNEVMGAVHAIKPPPSIPAHRSWEARHHIAWLTVTPEARGHRLGTRLLNAAENFLYYCPMHFAAQDAPFYGIQERLWAPWYGSTESMAISAVNDRELVAWLNKRGYQVSSPGDVTMSASLHDRERPEDPGLEARGLRLVMIHERSPWLGDEPVYQLRAWGENAGRRYQGLVVADGNRAVGSIVWYPMPDPTIAALAWIGLERQYRGLRFGSFLLDRALAEMANRGYISVEVHVHSKDNAEAFSLFKRRGFHVIDYWVHLVKT
jgi:ribosomal protein S18 acetylase RimI-like enzyme